jgi:hypothetical protein
MLILKTVGLTGKNSAPDSTLDMFKKAGRWIFRVYGPWADITEAFYYGLAEDELFEIEETEDAVQMYMLLSS